MAQSRQADRAVWAAVIVCAVAFPWIADFYGFPFYISVATRAFAYAIAAVGLNLVLGYGGMVSLGHAAFLGLGAYTSAILSTELSNANAPTWLASVPIVWLASLAVTVVFALVFGALSLRTRGAYFIMITLAFAQMLYFVFLSFTRYGGEDGLRAPGHLSLFGIDLGDEKMLYLVALACAIGAEFLVQRLLDSGYGETLVATRESEPRVTALGYSTYRTKLFAFIAGAGLAGLGGAILTELSQFVSPTVMSWQNSGNLMVMVILGGVGRPAAGLIGATVYIVLQELLSAWTEYWSVPLGIFLLVLVLVSRSGLSGLLAWRRGP
jgi:branched-chain amino acid transport system permease protein